ncbi:hypothetical protein ACJ41O_005432 [Fusarium nematophilum]
MNSRPLQFNHLPPELRDLIWESSLPSRRVFHVKGVHQYITTPSSRTMSFRFHIRHANPVALRTCRESRAVALRAGFFLSPRGDDPGVYFRTDADILYFDRNQRTLFQVKPNQPRVSVPGWDRVLNVGIEWRAFFRDTPRPSRGETTAGYWRAAIEPLYAYMPRMRTVNYILPFVRHKGGMTWGREPYGVQGFEPVLEELPEETEIPWQSTRNGGGVSRGQLMRDIQNPAGLSSLMVTWREVKEDIERGFAGEDESDGYPPEIVGWWMFRTGAPTKYDNPEVRGFPN